jgi:CHAT domain-containing protein/tetratricopeptide (TPR) repeat protein
MAFVAGPVLAVESDGHEQGLAAATRHLNVGQIDEARKAAEKVIELDREALSLAQRAEHFPQIRKAQRELADSLEVLSKALLQAGAIDEYLACLEELGSVEENAGRPERAEAALRRRLKTCEEKRVDAPLEMTGSLSLLGGLLFRTDRRSESVEMFQRALKIAETRIGENDLETACILHDLSLVQSVPEQEKESRAAFQRCLKIRDALRSSALKALKDGMHDEAKSAAEDAATLDQRILDPSEADEDRRAASYDRLAESLELQVRVLSDADEFDTRVDLMRQLADLAKTRGQRDREVDWVRRQWKAMQEKHGEDLPADASQVMTRLAFLLRADHPDETLALLVSTRKLIESKKAADDSYLVYLLQEIEFVCRSLGRVPEADEAQRRGLAVRKVSLERALSGLKEEKPAEAAEILMPVLRADRQAITAAGEDTKAAGAALERLAATLQPWIRAQRESGEFTSFLGALSELAEVERSLGHANLEEDALREHLRECERRYGGDQPEPVARSLENFAKFKERQKQHDEGVKALVRARKLLDEDDEDHAVALSSILLTLGQNYWHAGRLEDSEKTLLECLKLREAHFGADALETAMAASELASVYRFSNQPARAIPLLRRVLKAHEIHLGEDHLQVAEDLTSLAKTLWKLGQSREVLPLFTRSLSIYEARLPPDHRDIAVGLNNVAVNTKDPEEKLKLLERGLKILEAKFPEGNGDIGLQLFNMAIACAQIHSKRDEVLVYFRRSLKVFETAEGPNSVWVARCLDNMGRALEDNGKPEEAEAAFLRCAKIRETLLDPSDPDLVDNLLTVMPYAARRGDWVKVTDQLERINRRMRLNIRRNLPSLSTPRQLAWLHREHIPAFHRCLTLPFVQPTNQGILDRSAEWVLNGKAIGHEAWADEAALVRESGDPKAAELARELYAVRAESTSLAFRKKTLRSYNLSSIRKGAVPIIRAAFDDDDSPETREKVQRLQQLERRESELASQLMLMSASSRREDPWIKLDDVRARIPHDSVLVEIVDLDLWDFETGTWKLAPLQKPADQQRWGQLKDAQSRYAAWIIPPAGKGQVRLVDLGDSLAMREAIQVARKALSDSLRKIQIDEGDAEAEIRTHFRKVADLCLKPLESHLKAWPRWIISPDNDLWLVPMAALPLADGTYAIERHSISFVTSGRTLLAKEISATSGAPLVLGDPDFNLEPAAAQRQSEEVESPQQILLRGVSGEATRDVPRDWKRLPGTSVEIDAILPKLRKMAKEEPQVYRGFSALERRLTTARSPQVLVLSTHAFALAPKTDIPPTAPMAPPNPDGSQNATIPYRKIEVLFDGLQYSEIGGDPMIRCGVVLAGANRRTDRTDQSGDDGILTGVEILGCDLRGTELVVLSACETGLGDVNLGEGVAGLRQAFQLAGARSVVSSLWKISDAESATLMATFWENLAQGKSKADALREAQLEMIRSRRARGNAAHPFFWAAFSLTGDVR